MLTLISLLGLAFAGMAFVPGHGAEPDSDDADTPIREESEDQGDGDLLDDVNLQDGEPGEAADDLPIAGSDGDDLLQGGDDDDHVTGGAGRDELHGWGGDDVLDGGADADTLFAHIGDDSLSGGGGDDELVAGDGRDVLDGGAGDDSLQGNLGADVMTGGTGSDVLHGGEGGDVLYGADTGGAAVLDFLNGGHGDDALYGSAFDNLNGGEGQDIFALDAAGAATGAARVEDFDAAQDTLVVLYDGRCRARHACRAV